MAINFLKSGVTLKKDEVLISKDEVLNKQSGEVRLVDKLFDFRVDGKEKPLPSPIFIEDVEVKKDVEVVLGVDGQQIDLSLASSQGNYPALNGFLIEVYLSGADGKLSRVFQEDLVDVLNEDVVSEGFSNYLVLEVDK